MYRHGSASWKFGHGDMGFLSAALLVRDAAKLPVSAASDIPPRLAGNVPDCHDVLSPTEQGAAGGQWILWWRQLVGQAVREAQQKWDAPPSDDFEAVIQHRFGGREQVFDPPEFASLVAMEPLRSAVRPVLARPRERSNSQRHAEDPTIFAWHLVRDVADRTAADLGVPVGELHGYADVLDVEGVWWHIAGPGAVLCSTEAARDPSAAASVLRDVFSSGQR